MHAIHIQLKSSQRRGDGSKLPREVAISESSNPIFKVQNVYSHETLKNIYRHFSLTHSRQKKAKHCTNPRL